LPTNTPARVARWQARLGNDDARVRRQRGSRGRHAAVADRADVQGRTLAQMATAQAADDVAAFLNVTLAGMSLARRQHAQMIIVWTMDAAVASDKVSR
jgi:hypothetical protein